ncbi:hypothetical protein RHSIM_Rhsim05G0112000 [Rhododendron simsii]|uniref:snRNP core protein D2 n=1 Tax=Rhododendron simsii TaxID=118357 RepID=A0A834GZQ6_RHOSS|nr:hypothetical protein RHSIM_Rhsim05G0112000 [Rhododendron simsii]
MGPAAAKLYFDFRISLSTTATASNDPATATTSSAAGLRGSIVLPVPVIVAAIRLLPVTAVFVPSVVQVGGKTFFGPCAIGLLGICDTITATTTCSFELHRSDKESLKGARKIPVQMESNAADLYILCICRILEDGASRLMTMEMLILLLSYSEIARSRLMSLIMIMMTVYEYLWGDEEWMQAHLTVVNYVDIVAHILCTTVIAGIDNDGVLKMIVDVSYFFGHEWCTTFFCVTYESLALCVYGLHSSSTSSTLYPCRPRDYRDINTHYTSLRAPQQPHGCDSAFVDKSKKADTSYTEFQQLTAASRSPRRSCALSFSLSLSLLTAPTQTIDRSTTVDATSLPRDRRHPTGDRFPGVVSMSNPFGRPCGLLASVLGQLSPSGVFRGIRDGFRALISARLCLNAGVGDAVREGFVLAWVLSSGVFYLVRLCFHVSRCLLLLNEEQDEYLLTGDLGASIRISLGASPRHGCPPSLIVLPWNNKKLLGCIRAFDRHCNMMPENVREMWTEVPNTGKETLSERIVGMARLGESLVKTLVHLVIELVVLGVSIKIGTLETSLRVVFECFLLEKPELVTGSTELGLRLSRDQPLTESKASNPRPPQSSTIAAAILAPTLSQYGRFSPS